MGNNLKKQKIVVTLIPNRHGTQYERAVVTTDASKFLMECAFGEIILNNGTADMSKVRHTRKYIFKRKSELFLECTVHIIREIFDRTAHVLRAIREACSSDFDRNKYIGDMR